MTVGVSWQITKKNLDKVDKKAEEKQFRLFNLHTHTHVLMGVCVCVFHWVQDDPVDHSPSS